MKRKILSCSYFRIILISSNREVFQKIFLELILLFLSRNISLLESKRIVSIKRLIFHLLYC
ncbi:hypothetical protein AOE57_01115 [Candidatus Riesia pediculicola]|nr:hypothetical protein AOE57_01115 [Candidatus Riesia pediculicola]